MKTCLWVHLRLELNELVFEACHEEVFNALALFYCSAVPAKKGVHVESGWLQIVGEDLKWNNQENLKAEFVGREVCSEVEHDVDQFEYAVAILEDCNLIVAYDTMMSDMINNDSNQASQELNLSLLSRRWNGLDKLVKSFLCHVFLEKWLLSPRTEPCYNQLLILVITK